MTEKKKGGADFRYDTGQARIPWAAVGEPVRDRDVVELVKFLLPPGPSGKAAYAAQLKQVSAGIAALRACGSAAGKLTLGSKVEELEHRSAEMLGVKHTLFTSTATDGFEIAYKFAGLQPGDEVIAPAITFIATIAYPLSIGAKVVLADVDPRTVNMDPADVAKKITKKTKVIIPVHIGGRPVDMAPLMRLAKKHKITVIEDAAHAFGASYNGKMAGGIGDFGAFSFHEVKNVTSLGEGGLLATNSPFGKEFVKSRFLGLDMSHQITNWLYDVVALESRSGLFAAGNHSATEIQALCLLLQMKRLKGIIAKRRRAAAYLSRRFSKVDGLILPLDDTAKVKSSHHLYLLRVDPGKAGGDVQTLKAKLTERGVVSIPHFAPLYKFSIMRQLGYDTDAIQSSCPAAEEVFNHGFTHLPLYDFSPQDLKYMADAVIDAVSEMKAGR